MGIFDFEGLTDQDKKMMGLLALSTAFQNIGNLGARRPQVDPLGGVMGYYQNVLDNKDRALQRQLYGQQIAAQQAKIREQMDQDRAAENQAKYMFKSVGLDFDNLESDVGGFLPVSRSSEIKTSPVPAVGGFMQENIPLVSGDLDFAPPKQSSKLEKLFDKWGWEQEERDMFAAQAQADPKAAAKFLRDEMIVRRKASLAGRKEIGPKIGFEDAMIMRSQGVNIPGYEQYTPELATKYLGQKNIGRKAAAPSAVASIGNIMAGEAAETAGRKEGMEIGEQSAKIESKYSALDSIREAKAMLSRGIYSGYWGEMGKTIAKASKGSIGDRQKAARTEEFMAYIGNTVVPRLKEFDGHDSNEERRYLQIIMGGDVSMEPEAIANILDSAERKIMLGIERLLRQRGALEKGRMPDLGPGPSRAQPQKPQAPVGVKKPSVSNWNEKYHDNVR
jgi:hypothetical protein